MDPVLLLAEQPVLQQGRDAAEFAAELEAQPLLFWDCAADAYAPRRPPNRFVRYLHEAAGFTPAGCQDGAQAHARARSHRVKPARPRAVAAASAREPRWIGPWPGRSMSAPSSPMMSSDTAAVP